MLETNIQSPRAGAAYGDASRATPTKNRSIDALRGAAIVLILAYHLVNDEELSSVATLYDWLGYSFQNIRLPLFTVISGYLYGLRPLVAHGALGFLAKKARRLLLPAIAVASLQYSASALMPGVNNPEELAGIWRVWVFGYEHFWFLQSIIIIFALVSLLEAARVFESITSWLVVVAVAFLVAAAPLSIKSGYDFFSVGGAIYLFPFFLLGCGISRYSLFRYRRVAIGALVLFLALLLAQQSVYISGLQELFSKRSVGGLVLALSAGIVLLRWPLQGRTLAWIGQYAFTIYLWQGFTLAVGRRGSGLLDLEGHLYFLVTLVIGVVGGIFIHRAAAQIPVVRTLALGLR